MDQSFRPDPHRLLGADSANNLILLCAQRQLQRQRRPGPHLSRMGPDSRRQRGHRQRLHQRRSITAYRRLPPGQAAITVNAVNDAPVLDNTGTMTVTAINEDETNTGRHHHRQPHRQRRRRSHHRR